MKLEETLGKIIELSREELGMVRKRGEEKTAARGYAIEQRAGNRDVPRRWIARGTPRAEAAAAARGRLLAGRGSAGDRERDLGDDRGSVTRRAIHRHDPP